MGVLRAVRSILSAIVLPFGYEIVATETDDSPRPLKFSYINPIVTEAELRAGRGDFDGMLTSLQQLSLADFAWLLLAPPPKVPALTSMLPRMASKEVQLRWTGAHGAPLLINSLLFAKSMEASFSRFAGRQLHGATILDFGCGWGRLLRLMLWFSHPDKIYGVDPWDKSLQICAEDGVLGSRAESDWIPNTLPFEGVQFDLVYAFSVFTHLSERTMMAAQRAIRQRIKSDGLFVITIRPVEYWDVDPISADPQKHSAVLAQHRERGFAFVPHDGKPVDGEVTYGDTSMTFDYIRENWASWQLRGYDHNIQDSNQITVFLTPN
jgi:2-polyprenyl-3-methyl-5-hydroxy-6-metoxy-1,4-benzoquinol methylase